MATTYSTNLALSLLATGEQAGLWGDITNTNLGSLLEQAISGYQTQAMSDSGDTTITIPNGATGVARNMYIELTGTLTAARNLIVPSNRKLYFIYNNTSGGYAVTVKPSAGTGISVPAGTKYLLVSDGTNVIEATSFLKGPSSYTIGDILYANSSSTLTTLADVATGNALISGGTSTAPSWGKVGLTTHITGTLAAANGGTGQASYTVGDIVYASGTTTLSALADVATGNVLLSGGTGTAPSYGKVGLSTHVSGTLPTANGGTGQTTYSDGQLLIGNGSTGGLSRANITAGANVTITNGPGTITIAASGGSGGGGTVTSVSGTGTVNGLTLTGLVTTTGSLTLGGTLSGVSLSTAVTGTLAAANGGTGQSSYSTGDLLYASGGTALSRLAAVATGNVLTSSGTGAAPAWGKVGLTTAVTGTLPVANGGTGTTTSTGSGNLVLATSPTISSPALTGTPTSGGIEIGYRSVPRASTGGATAATSERGYCYATTGNMTIPASTFAAGDALSIYNDSSSSVTITQGSGLTLRQAGSTNTGSRTLAARGMVTIWFNSATEAIISGAGLS